MAKKKSLIGEKYGSVIVISQDNKIHVKCDCGFEYQLTRHGLYEHRYVFGCRKCFDQRHKTKNKINTTMWNSIKSNAMVRSIPIDSDITREYLWELYLKQNKKCAYSGFDIILTTENRTANTASLDRIDSTKHYSKCNIHWIRKDINLMKLNLNEKRFLDLCQLIAEKSYE